MELSGVSQAGIYNVIEQGMTGVSCEDKNSSFQNYIDELQIKNDIIEHLKGVPLNTVTIPPRAYLKTPNDCAILPKAR